MKVSVIIPLFNAEKYFAVCLESLTIQTMTDFEVIVVDDCSTDSSLAIAESYLERFGGRLKIITLPQNTGNPAIPRNVGLEHARGEYVYFIDNDDLLVDDALETLYDFATEYGADVVYMDCGFICGAEPVPKKITLATWQSNAAVENFKIDPNDISERMKKFLALQYNWPPWSKFLRRDFLVDNDIKFLRMTTSEDIPWTFKLLCLAKKILHVPTPLYVNRNNRDSLSRRRRLPEQELSFWSNPLLKGLDYLDEFMRTHDYFKQNPDIRLQVLNFFTTIHFEHMNDALKSLSPEKVYEIFLREFSKASSQPALISYLFAMNILYRNELI